MSKIFLLSFIFLILNNCSNTYNWGWYVINPTLDEGYTNLLFLINGLNITITISLISIFFSLLIGFFIALLNLSSNKYFNYLNRLYVEFFRENK